MSGGMRERRGNGGWGGREGARGGRIRDRGWRGK